MLTDFTEENSYYSLGRVKKRFTFIGYEASKNVTWSWQS